MPYVFCAEELLIGKSLTEASRDAISPIVTERGCSLEGWINHGDMTEIRNLVVDCRKINHKNRLQYF